MKKLENGRFIVFEGIDGSGKTLQLTRAATLLLNLGYSVTTLREPSDGKWGKKIRSIYSEKLPPVSPEKELNLFVRDAIPDETLRPTHVSPEKELNLFVRDRQDNILRNIKPSLQTGNIVLQDRYFYSTLAYQGAKGFDSKYIEDLHKPFIIYPDLLLIFDIDPSKGLERIATLRKSDLSIFEKIEFLQKVKSIYDSFTDSFIVHVDANQTPDKIENSVREAIISLLQRS